jgi:hypothetical protein
VTCPECKASVTVPDSAFAAEEAVAPGPAPATSPAGQPGEARRPCPMCGEMILASAIKCRFCGEVFDETLRRLEKKGTVAAQDANLGPAEILVAILCAGIGCIIGVVWMIQGKPKGTKMFGISFVAGIIWNIIFYFIESAAKRP